MTAFRYVISLPREHEAARTMRRVEAPELVPTSAPAIWCSDPRYLIRAGDGRMVIIGNLFDRARSGTVAKLPASTVNGSSIIESLTEDFWGSYLALRAADDCFEVLRDPTGLMPCYYVQRDDRIILASDVHTLRHADSTPLDIEWDRLFEFLLAPGVRRSATCLAGVMELRPGALASFRRGQCLERPLWSPWHFAQPEYRIASEEAVDAVRQGVSTSIGAIAGGFRNIVVGMSGGLDSSVVCAALAATGKSFSALTMHTIDPSGDERTYARLVAERTGARLLEHCYDVERIDLYRSVSNHLPRPVGRTFMQEIEHAFAEEIQNHGFDAIFTGNGGDNVFCYLHSAAPVVDRLRSAGERTRFVATLVDMCAVTQCDIVTMARATLSLLRARPRVREKYDWNLMNRRRTGYRPSPVLTPYLEASGGLPGKRGQIDMLVRIQNHVEGYDRGKMPPVIPVLLTQPVVETCLRIASWDWCRGGINRAVAREAFSPLLPAAVIARRSKSGPESLIAEVFELGRRALREMLLGGLLRKNRIVDAASLEAAFDDPAVTRGQLLFRILELAEAEAWARSWAGADSRAQDTLVGAPFSANHRSY